MARLCEGCGLVGTDIADDVLQAALVGSQGKGQSSLAKLFGLGEADADEAGAHAGVVVPPISESAMVSPESWHRRCHMHLQMWSCCTEPSSRPHTYLSRFIASFMVLHHLHMGLSNVC